MESASKKTEDQQAKKPAPQVEIKGAEQEALGYETNPMASRGLEQLPTGPGTRAMRQAAVLQMQKTQGNAFVMRQMAQRQEELPQAGEPAAAPTGEGGSQTSIGDGGSSVTAEGGTVTIDGGMVTVNAGVTRVNGILQTDTIIATNVVGTTYTPGVGNLM